MNGIVATEFFDGKLAVAARYTNGDVLYFYDGTEGANWAVGSGDRVEGKRPVALLTHDDKMYAIYESVLDFSTIADAADWTGTGSGFKNMANQSAGSETLTALGRYQNLMAIFARRNTQIFFLDPDPLQNVKRQVLENIGTFAPNSVISFGDVDVFFLSDTGIRSLRSRSNSDRAGVSDVGTPIDDEMIAYLKTLTEAEKAAAVSVIDPIDGRYILSIGDRSYVFSYYADAKISAWSRYALGFTVADYVSMDGRIWARGADTVYLFGGDDSETYDSSEVEVDLPYIDGRQIATWKNFTALDVVCEGSWAVYANSDPQNPAAESLIATIDGTTLNLDGIGFIGHAPVVKLRLVNSAPGPAKLSKIIVHYTAAEAT
jgi:hypothetical protein